MGLFDRFRKPRSEDAFPRFKYHPDPLATGAVKASDATCLCCGRTRGFVYTHAPYSRRDDLEGAVCPWCIADGSAARKFQARFVPDAEDELPAAAGRELFERTPGYLSWQGENWLCHHGDACEFHGDATHEDFNALTETEEALFLEENDFLGDWWADMKIKHDNRASDVGVYRFRCRHCGLTRLGVDMS
jgi:uncharacterized protein CbrC (UPF0167 family)